MKKNILFLCTGNSCRSQMAEGWANHLKGNQYHFYSAGIETHGLNLNAVLVMHEVGIDISAHTSNHLNDYEHITFDYVITVCSHADQKCPIFPGKTQVIHHGFDDPPKLAKNAKTKEQALVFYRQVRDQIKEFIYHLEQYL